MVSRRAIPQSNPPFTEAFVDLTTGRVSGSWQRWINNTFARQGGTQDDIWLGLFQQAVSSTFIQSLQQTISDQDILIAELITQQASAKSYDDQIEELRIQVAAAQQTYDSILQQQEVIRQENENQNAQAQAVALQSYYANVSQIGSNQSYVQSLTTTQIPEGANFYYSDARARAAISASAPLSYNSTTGALSVALATVATTGAYGDLTGSPTLGTASAQNTGTSGHNLTFADGANTWSSIQTNSAPLGLPAYTVAGLPAAGSNTNGIAIATDLLAPAIGSVVVGGGAVRSTVVSDGTNWRAA